MRRTDPNLRLHAYVLSVTPDAQINDSARPAAGWKRDGVYFLNERDCLKEVYRARPAPVPRVSRTGQTPHSIHRREIW